MMKLRVKLLLVLSFFISIEVLANPNWPNEPRPGTPETLTAVNAATYKLSGYCASGGGDVTINFGSLSFVATCGDVLGAYQYIGDVSAETTTNPISQCIDQFPFSTVCSATVDNELAPPGIALDFAPLPSINDDNELSYTVYGTCAPVGASVSIDIGASSGILSGTCVSQNKFLATGDVSSLPDSLGLSVTVNITAVSGTNSQTTTVDKAPAGLDPVPTIVNVTTAFVDGDSDTWLEAGDQVDFLVEFSEVVTASPSVLLKIGLDSADKGVSYFSGSGTTILTFRMPVVLGDEQCNAIVSLQGIDLNAGTIVDGSVQAADFNAMPSLVVVEKIDAEAPEFEFGLDVLTVDGTDLESPVIGGEDFRGQDNCTATRVESAIGTTIGGVDTVPYTEIPSGVFSYRISDGVDGFSVLLLGGTDYFTSNRVYDEAGNESAVVTTAAWTISPLFTIPNLIVYLDASDPNSVLDDSGDPSDSGSFDGFVDSFLDTSGSTFTHNFTAFSAAQEPSFSVANSSLVFDGVNDCMETPNHSEINTSTVTQRSFSTLLRTGGSVTPLQMFFEEGGGTRGINTYVYQDRIYCGFWNATNDGDGAQAFVSQSTPVLANTIYNITTVFDYTNYTGPAGPNGTFDCYVNGVSMGASSSITSRLFAHSGDVSLGCSGDSTRTHLGTSGADYEYGGEIMEHMMFNSPPSATDALDLYNFLQAKWGF